MLQWIAAYLATVAIAGGMLHPALQAKDLDANRRLVHVLPRRLYALAAGGPLTILFLLGDTLMRLIDKLTRDKEDASA